MSDGTQSPNPNPVRPFRLRARLPWLWSALLGLIPLIVVLSIWTLLTYGEKVEDRFISSVILPSPVEVAVSFKSLWFERALMWSILYSLARVGAGFGVAVIIALPLGIAMGAFSVVRGIFNPVAVIGGYLPIAALVPLTLSWFGTNETQKVAFLAIAAFVYLLPLVIQAVDDVDEIYLKTAYTLGVSQLGAVFRVLMPIAMGRIYDGMRLAFGVGWTYIILAEIVDAQRGLGYLIMIAQRRGPREHIYLVLLVIIVLGFLIDKGLELMGRQLFPHRRMKR